jgi:negative regulator of flagellin synthesis FlgM
VKLNTTIPGQTSPALQKATGSNPSGANTTVIAPAAAQVTVNAGTSGNVTLSPMTAALIAAASDPSGDIDAPRVDELRSAIANGTLRIDAAKIADGLLVTTQELIRMPS